MMKTKQVGIGNPGSETVLEFMYALPYKNEKGCCKVAARLLLLCSNQICMQQLVATKKPIRAASCLFAATLQLLSAATGSQSNYCSQLQLAAVTSKKTARTHSLYFKESNIK